MRLMKQAKHDARAAEKTFEYSWGVFLRSFLRPLHFYAFSGLAHERFIMVAENKVSAGKETQFKGDALKLPNISNNALVTKKERGTLRGTLK